MTINTQPNYLPMTHARLSSLRLNDSERRDVDKLMKLLNHSLDVKNVRRAKKQTEALAKLLAGILSAR